MKVVKILTYVRNALAHANIYSLPNKADQIENVIFLSRIMNGCKFSGKYVFLTVSSEDFYKFLVKWIHFLETLSLPLE